MNKDCFMSQKSQADIARNTSAALVPPKPKLFDITVRSGASRVSRRIRASPTRGYGVSMFAEAAMKHRSPDRA